MLTIKELNNKVNYFNEKIMLSEEDFQNFAFKFNGNNNNEDLFNYNDILKRYFDITDSNSLIAFRETKKNFLDNFKEGVSEKVVQIKGDFPEITQLQIRKEFEYISLIEMVFIEKYKKLINKTINNTINGRVVGNAGDILGKDEGGIHTKKGPNRQEKLKGEAQSYAIEGFLLGMRRYQPSAGTKLITYVTYWVNQRIVMYVERSSSLNKAKKSFNGLDEYTMEDNVNYKVYDNIKYTNYNFVNIGDMAGSISQESTDIIDTVDERKKLIKILRFFCENKDLLLYYEYLILKYDILYETYIYFTLIDPNEQIKECFYKDVNKIIDKLSVDFPELKDFKPHENVNKLPDLLETFFNLEHSEYLAVRRTLKQKFVNILTKVFSFDIDF
jgi:hypothetical protein